MEKTIQRTIPRTSSCEIYDCDVKTSEDIMKRDVLIRNKKEAEKLSKQTIISLEDGRQQRLREAEKNNDMLYLSSVFENVSVLAIIKILFIKSLKYIK